MRRRLDIGIFSSQSHAKIELYIAVYLMYIEQKNTKRRKQKKRRRRRRTQSDAGEHKNHLFKYIQFVHRRQSMTTKCAYVLYRNIILYAMCIN